MIRIAGAQVPVSAVAELVRRMSTDGHSKLATELGRAIDGGADEYNLHKRDYAALLIAIEHHAVDGLEPLRAALDGTGRQKPTSIPAPDVSEVLAPAQ